MVNREDMSIEETYILSRYLYRSGSSLVSDATYDAIHAYFVGSGDLPEYTSRTYDDDPIPTALLQKYGYLNLEFETGTNKDASFLIEDKSKSIRSVTNVEQVFDFCQRFKQRKCLSVKMDGNNIKNEINESVLKLSLTRGRASNGIDVTDAMHRLMPPGMNIPGHRVLTGEVFLDPLYIDIMREKYGSGDNYKTAKSAAISFLRRPQDHAEADYRYLEFRVFACPGLADTVVDTYQALNKSGFKTPPYLVIEETPQTLEEFRPWLLTRMDELCEMQGGLPADGLVLELDDLLTETVITDQYDERQLALKFYHWKAQTYKGKITSIIVEQRRVFCCCKVTIEPLVTSDGCEASMINIYNPSFLINDELHVGDEVDFERASGTVNIMINGKKMKLSVDDDDE